MDFLKRFLINSTLSAADSQKVDRAVVHLNSAGYDDWGVDPKTVKAALAVLQVMYRRYFRVTTVGIEQVPQGRVLLIPNHSGQIPWDGLLIGMSMILEAEPPRLVRSMVERWFPALPFISTLFTRCGQVVGDQRNCRDLLSQDECVLVFPEGVNGLGKPYSKRYQLQKFGTGFLRLALETRTPIVPVGVIGCEETYPSIASLKVIGKALGLPYFPVTPFFPLLGPLGAVPIPAKVTLRFGKPLVFEDSPDAPDALITQRVEEVQAAINQELKLGLKDRGDP